MTRVTKEFYDVGGRKYIKLDEVTVKVPFRYNRVMCTVKGHTPVQDYKLGDEVNALIEYRTWDGERFPVLKEIGLSKDT